MTLYDQKPWLPSYGDIHASMNYPRVTMVEALMQSVERNPDAIAYDFDALWALCPGNRY